MPKRKPRKPRPKKVGIPKGYDSLWALSLHEPVLKKWSHHKDCIDYVIEHKYDPDFVKKIKREKLYILNFF